MPGYGPSRSSSPLRDLARKLTPEEQKTVDARREQDRRDGEEVERTRLASKACTGRRSYLMLCDAYTSPAGSDLRAHRLIAARDAEVTDPRAHIVPAGTDGSVRAICGVGPGREMGGWGWGRTLSQASCPECILRTDTTRVGSPKPGTGDRVPVVTPGYLYPRPIRKDPDRFGWWS